MPSRASVTVRPSPSTTQPGGSGQPFRSCTLILPAAVVVVAMSSTKGWLRPAGAAKAIGFVPSTGTAPRVGTMLTWRVALVTSPTAPRAAAMRAYTPAAPKWCELRTATTPTPTASALSTARFIAIADTGWPRPAPASSSAVQGPSRTTTGRARRSSLPSRTRSS